MTQQAVGSCLVVGVCDGCGYIEDQYGAESVPAVNKDDIGYYLRMSGWLWNDGGGRDLCPDCSVQCPECYGRGCRDCAGSGLVDPETDNL